MSVSVSFSLLLVLSEFAFPGLELVDNSMKRKLIQAALVSLPAATHKRLRTTLEFAKQPHIFCDLDGVLVDFDAGVQNLFQRKVNVNELPSNVLWKSIGKTPNFFRNLPWVCRRTPLFR